MHSFHRVALRAAAAHGSRVAVATPRTALALDALKLGAYRSASANATLSRPFSATRFLANQVDTPEQEATSSSTEEPSPKAAAAVEAVAGEAAAEKASPSQEYADGQETPYGLFVRNIVFDANEEHITEAFEKYGRITKTVIARDARGLSRGYAFVYFTNMDDMNSAATGANGSFWHGRRIQAAPRLKGTVTPRRDNKVPLLERTPTSALYIGNIPYETTDAELNKLFRSLENIKDVRIAVDRSTGWPRGFAHADFADVESAVEAAKKLSKVVLLGRELRIDFSQGTRSPRNGPADVTGSGAGLDKDGTNPL